MSHPDREYYLNARKQDAEQKARIVEREHLRLTAVEKSLQALTNACQIIDVVKLEWAAENAWSEWDQQVREQITEALRACYAARDPSKATHSAECGRVYPTDCPVCNPSQPST